MKKTNLLLTLLATFALAACGGSSSDNSDNLDVPNDNGGQKLSSYPIDSFDLYSQYFQESANTTFEEITLNDKKVNKDDGSIPLKSGMNTGTFKTTGSDQTKKIVIYSTPLNNSMAYETSDGYMMSFKYGNPKSEKRSKENLIKFAGDSGKISYEGVAISSMDMLNPGKFTYELDVAKLTGHGKIEGISKLKHEGEVYTDVEITLPEVEFTDDFFSSSTDNQILSSKEFNGPIELFVNLSISGKGEEIMGYSTDGGNLKHTLRMAAEAK